MRLHTVLAVPSVQAADAVADEARQVVETRLATLSAEQLEALETRMEQAVEANERPVPRELIANIPVPSIDGIFVRSQASCVVSRGEIADLWDGGNGDLRSALEREANEVKQRYLWEWPVISSGIAYPVLLTTHASDFCAISAVLSTSALSIRAKRLLPLLLVRLLECPLRCASGEVRSSEAVIDFIYRHTTSSELHLGIRACAGYEVNRFCELVKLSVEVEADQIPLGLKLLFDLLRNSFVTAERLLITAERTVKLLEEQVHDGDNVCGILARRQTLSETSCYNCFDHVLLRRAFHRRSG